MLLKTVDLMCAAKWIVPVEPRGVVLTNHCMVVDKGKIIALVPKTVFSKKYRARKTILKPNHLIIPGFINAHTHAAMSLFRGLADDLPLMDWLKYHIWPAESAWLSPAFVEDGTRLAIAEMLRGGTTCFNDMYFFPNIVGKTAAAVGIRASVGLIVIGHPTAWAKTEADYFEKATAVYQQFREHPFISMTLSPHAPYSVSEQALKQMASLAEKWNLPIQIHLHETKQEMDLEKEKYHKRPLQRLFELSFGETPVQYVHMAWLNPKDISILEKSNATVVHCPESNLKLASGFCPVQTLLNHNIPVALGTDGAASNNDLDMLQEMRSAAFMAKAVTQNPSALNAFQALEMATLNGARAMGIDAITGSLSIGKSADFIALDFSEPEMQPVYHPVSQLVYAATRHQVTDVWVRGQQLLMNRVLTTLDLTQILINAQRWKKRILGPNKIK